MDDKHIIEPERHGLWIAVACIIAMLALVVSFVAIWRIWVLASVTQAEFVVLSKRLDAQQKAPVVIPPPAALVPALPTGKPEGK